MRLGELLISEGLVDDAQVERALRAQTGLGGRLGTNLIEMRAVDADTVASALARQKGVAAARYKHMQRADDSHILKLVPRHLAERLFAIPLGYATRFGRELVVAFMDPDDIAAVEEIAEVTRARVRPCVAPEFYIIHYLERYYGIPPRRYLRVSPDDAALPTASSNRWPVTPPEERTPVPEIRIADIIAMTPMGNDGFDVDAGWDLPEEVLPAAKSQPRAQPAQQPRPQPAPEPLPPAPEPLPPAPEPTPAAPALPRMTAVEAIAAIETAEDREAIGEAITAFLRHMFACGLVLICRKEAALGWRGHAPFADPTAIEAISIPLTLPSAFATAYAEKVMFQGPPPPEGHDIQTRLWKLVRCEEPLELLVAPIAIAGRVVNLVYAQGIRGRPLPASAADGLRTVCDAAARGYVRLIQSKKSG